MQRVQSCSFSPLCAWGAHRILTFTGTSTHPPRRILDEAPLLAQLRQRRQAERKQEGFGMGVAFPYALSVESAAC